MGRLPDGPLRGSSARRRRGCSRQSGGYRSMSENTSGGTLQESIARQREILAELLRIPLGELAQTCGRVWGRREDLNAALIQALRQLPYCKYLYALDSDAVQVSDNVSHQGVVGEDFGRDRSQRPYMHQATPGNDYFLSESYISLRAGRPSLTAVQRVRDGEGRQLGYVGADFDLRNLPLTRELYEEPTAWRQVKGDPAIRGTVFYQSRVESEMDRQIASVIGVMHELMAEHGVFHGKLHFSSSRATVWLLDDPYRYRLLDIAALTDPDVCLAYPRHSYPGEAVVPVERIREVLEGFGQLRVMDETFYLRAGSLNIFNGLVGLTFSCDGSHYLSYDEFLNRDHAVWVASRAP